MSAQPTDLTMRQFMKQAEKSGQYLCCISYIEADGKTIQHHHSTINFPRGEIFPAIREWVGAFRGEAEPEKRQSEGS